MTCVSPWSSVAPWCMLTIQLFSICLRMLMSCNCRCNMTCNQSLSGWKKIDWVWMQEKPNLCWLAPKQRLVRIRPMSISLNEEQIETVPTFEYLGLILDSQLQFHDNIDSIVKKTTMKLGLLYKTRWLFDQETASMLFKTLITRYFDFESVVYEVSSQYQLNRL